MPRRRSRARAAAVEPEAERGLAMRLLLHSPKDMIAGVLAFAAVSAIITNALFLQAGRHPSPMFGSVVTLPASGLAAANPLPRPRPLEADAAQAEPRLAEPRSVETRLAEPKPVEKVAEPKAADPLGSLVNATGAPAAPASMLRPPAPIPALSRKDAAARRVAAVQRALTENGYGQLKPNGAMGADTQAAIQRFERERRLPVTGQVSDRLVRELAVEIGHPID
jgi:Putative peptidoglycan binding domain